MNPALQALRSGLARGWIQFRHIITTPDGLSNTVFWNGVPLLALFFFRDLMIEETGLSFATTALPGVLGMIVGFSAMGPAYYLATEREDGTLLRAKALPHGMLGYVTGLITVTFLETLIGLVGIFVGAVFILGGSTVTVTGWLAVLGYFVLGIMATVPIGFAIGSVIKSPRVIGGLGFLALGALSVISGIWFPIQVLQDWVQLIAQAFPIYWLGLGMRSAMLPEVAMAVEIGASWRTGETLLVLGAWAAAGLTLAPVLLRRMARRESGSAVEARRLEAMQRIG